MEPTNAKVYIVGAGPGDPGLITVKAMDKLKLADVVVYDRLINNDLLSYCKKDCEKIFVGKESGYHSIEQERISEILIKKSKPGSIVVRLKGGNPFIFGRGSEEAIALKKAGIDFEIIPGITSGLSAPVYSGIPITQRGLITQCVLITAHECPGKPETQVEWEKLAKLKNTSLIIYMGASRIERICSELIKHGMDPAMPVAAIENGTLPNQRTITGRLDEIAVEFKKQNFRAPVIILISPTVSLRYNISWFENKPLFNKRIVIAGDRNQSRNLRDVLYELGGEVLILPVIKTQVRFNEENLWTSSENPQKTFQENQAGYRNLNWTNLKINGDNFSHLLWVQANMKQDSSYDILSEELSKYGVAVSANEIFNIVQNEPEIELLDNIKKYGADVFIFNAPLAVDHFFNIFNCETALKLLNNSKTIALSQPTVKVLAKRNVKNIIIPDCNSVKGNYDFITNLFNQKRG
jgi:uroporphyrin-III C-methyltransferase